MKVGDFMEFVHCKYCGKLSVSSVDSVYICPDCSLIALGEECIKNLVSVRSSINKLMDYYKNSIDNKIKDDSFGLL